MRAVVLGAGAVGGGVAALLHRVDARTCVVARGATLEAVRAQGLRFWQREEQWTARPEAYAGLDRVEWTDDSVLLVAVKSHQTAALVPLLRHVPAHVPVVALQNGVDNERLLLRHRPDVHGVVVMMPASSLEPGQVVLHSGDRPGLLDVGRYPAGTDAVDEALSAHLRSAGFESEPRADVMAWKRRKLLLNLGNAVDAACVPGPDADRLREVLRAEGVAALRAAGLAVVSEEQDAERRGSLLRPLLRRDEAGSSTWQSVARGAAETEADHLNGEVVLLGRLHGVPTPANEAVRRALADLVAAGGQPRTVEAGGLLAGLSDAGGRC